MTPASADWAWVPKRDWEWRVGDTQHGVHTYEGQLVWWERPDGPGGYWAEVAVAQSFADFLAAGPRLPAPEEVVEALRALLRPPPETPTY